MTVELAVGDFLGRLRDRLRAPRVEGAEVMVHLGRRALDEAQRAGDRLRHALLADAEVVARAFGLSAPEPIGGHLDRPEGVGLGARVGHKLYGRRATEDRRRTRAALCFVLRFSIVRSSVLYFLRKRSSRTTSAPPVGLSGSSSDGASVGSADLAAAETAGAVRGCLGSATGRAVAISPCLAGTAASCGAGTCLEPLGTSATGSNVTPNST